MQHKLVYIYLYIRTKLKIVANYILRSLFKVKSIYAVANENMTNVILRYYLVHILNFFINTLVYFRNLIDMQCDKIQTTLRTNSKDKTFILDKENTNSEYVTFNDISQKISGNEEIVDNKNMKYIMTKVEIHYDDSTKTCFKKYVEQYKDIDENYHHTIKNIMLFNNVEYCPKSKFVIELFNKGKLEKNTYHIQDVYDEHINCLSSEKNE